MHFVPWPRASATRDRWRLRFWQMVTRGVHSAGYTWQWTHRTLALTCLKPFVNDGHACDRYRGSATIELSLPCGTRKKPRQTTRVGYFTTAGGRVPKLQDRSSHNERARGQFKACRPSHPCRSRRTSWGQPGWAVGCPWLPYLPRSGGQQRYLQRTAQVNTSRLSRRNGRQLLNGARAHQATGHASDCQNQRAAGDTTDDKSHKDQIVQMDLGCYSLETLTLLSLSVSVKWRMYAVGTKRHHDAIADCLIYLFHAPA